MKVITEEILKRKIADYDLANCDLSEPLIISKLISECKEIDTLTVSKLRPMCEVNPGETILLKVKSIDYLYSCKLSDDDDLSGCEGWIPMPVYKPEQP